MIVTIIALGSQGDVQPYTALAYGLQQAGFTVRMATHANFQPFIESYGLDFYTVGKEDIKQLMETPEAKRLLKQKNPIKMFQGMRDLMRPNINDVLRDTTIALQGADLAIIAGLAIFGGLDACLKLGIPVMATGLQPIVETTQIQTSVMPVYPSKLPGKKLYNYVSHLLFMQIFWQTMRPVINDGRKEVWGDDKAPFWGFWNKEQKLKSWLLFGYSNHILNLKNEGKFKDRICTAGYLYLNEPIGWTPPQKLVDFLDAGEPPIYIGFGSMTDENPVKTAERAVEALQATGQRGILLTGWGGMAEIDLPDSIMAISSCPHSWLFPRMKGIVHHGGAGTTAASFRAGKPQVVTPFFADQPFWGDIVYKLGVGVKPIRHKDNTAEKLTEAINIICQDVVMQRKATELGKKIRAEDGVATAVEFVKRAGRELGKYPTK